MAHLSEKALERIGEICEQYESEATPLMMILSDIQNEFGYIPLEVQEIVSERTTVYRSRRYTELSHSTPSFSPTQGQIHNRLLPRHRLLCQGRTAGY